MKKSFLLSLSIAIFAILVIVLIVVLSKPVIFNSVKLPENNSIINRSSKPYLDTIVAIGMDELEADSFYISIRDLTAELKNNPAVNGLDLGAVIFGSGKSYIIYVDTKIDKKSAIDVICHELIHLKQYSSGDLIVLDGSSGLVQWKGEKIEVLNLDYNLRPWEIEAFSEQRKLSEKVKEVLIPDF